MTTDPASRAVDALIAEGLLDDADRDRSLDVVRQALDEPTAPAKAGLPKLVEVVAYLGGALVLAAGGLFLLLTWDELGQGGQIGALGVVTLVLAAAGSGAIAGREDGDEVRRRLGGTLFTGAALTAGFVTALVIELGDRSWIDTVYVPGAAAAGVVAVLAGVGYTLAPTAVGQLGVLGGLLVATVIMTSAQDGDESLWVGLTFLLVGLVWVAVSESGLLVEETIGRALGVTSALFGAQFVTLAGDHTVFGYALTAGVVVGGVVLYLSRLDWPYLMAAVLGLTLVVPEAVNDWTGGSLGAVGAVLVAGVALLGASFAGYKLYVEASD